MTTLETSTDQPQYQLVIDGRRVEAVPATVEALRQFRMPIPFKRGA